MLLRFPVAAALIVRVAACGGEGTDPSPTFDLTFEGDGSFRGPHANQPVQVALLRTSDNVVVGIQDGTVSPTGASSFSFTFPQSLEAGVAYEVHYWIDSNFGGGDAGVCDPPSTDHQWRVSVPPATADLRVTEFHDAADVADVCPTFP